MTPDEVKRLRVLLAYLDRWQAAHEFWLKWIDTEYDRRLAQFVSFRIKAEDRLLHAGDGLKYSERRVDATTAAGDRAKRKMLERCNEIYAAIVMKGQDAFAISGRRDRAGIYRGNIERAFRRIAVKALREAFDAR